jgi:translation initiation factor 2 beta subunit (eIF-2beta)/eIF-5
VSDKPPPPKPRTDDELDVDYLVCRQCNSPCYTFEMEKGTLTEAQCLVCGNDDLILFNIGEDQPDE